MKKRKYLVTGGTGFIGSALVKRLVQEGHHVRVLDSNLRGVTSRLNDIADRIEMVDADIRDASAVQAACKGIDCVCHLAYLNGTEFFYSMPELVLDIAVKGMVNILDACIICGVKDFVLASSSEVYQSPPVVPTPETVPLVVPDPHNPRYSYGGGKIICELMALNYGRKHFDRTTIFRPHNVYGPDMGWEHVLPQFVSRMKSLVRQQSSGVIDFPIQGSGKETRSFVYIDDFIDGLLCMIDRGENLGIYHIGTMDELAIEEVALILGDYFGRKVRVIPGELLAGGTVRRCPDISKLMNLGYLPKIGFEQGLAKTALWYCENEHKKNLQEIHGG